MPRYFFHVKNGNRIYPDAEGVKLPDLEAARDYALRDARDLMCQDADHVEDPAEWEIQICDQTGQQFLTLPFSEAVRGSAAPKRR